MPFKSEAQRKYLWANEPEIARDWTDTYGSRIQKLHGGITHPDGRRGFFEGAQREAREEGKPMSPGTSAIGGGRGREGPPGISTVARPTITQPKKQLVDRGDGLLQKFKNYQDTYNTAARMKHIRSLNPEQINKLIAAGVIDRTGDVYGTSRLQDIEGIDLSSAENLEKLRDLTDYTGGIPTPGTGGEGGGGQDPWLYPQTGITAASTAPTTSTASTLGGGDYLVPLEYVIGQQRAAEGGIIGSVGGTSRQKYQMGNMVGAEMEGAEMEGAMMQSQEVIKELYDALIAQGLSPQEAIEKIKEIIASTQTQEPESPMMGEEFPGQEFGGGPRAPAAFGGIMDTYTGRRKYGLGSFIKKAFKKVKKLASSKLGKLALMYAAGTYLGGMEAFGGPQGGMGWKKFGARLLDPMTTQGGISNVGRSAMNLFTGSPQAAAVSTAGQPVGVERLNLPQLAKETVKKGAGDWSKWILPASIGAGAYTALAPIEGLDDTTSEWDEDKAKWDAYYANLGGSYRVPDEYIKSAQGGRIGRQEGGLMDLGGMEKDYRDDGGFVPLGGEEKADDVPARLSKNEFVFTADAVRNAGGGDIDRGAEVMENVMKNLEAGGQVSEESQGQGAQEMFEVSERLSEVV
jgi:hypothetical protein